MRIIGWDDSAELLLHYLGGSGEKYSLDVNEVIREAEGIRNKFSNMVLEALDNVLRQIRDGNKSGQVSADGNVDHLELALSGDVNWYGALGGFNPSCKGNFESSDNAITLKIRFTITDRYDFQGTPVFDYWEFNGQKLSTFTNTLQQLGYAKEFDVEGTSSEYKWRFEPKFLIPVNFSTYFWHNTQKPW